MKATLEFNLPEDNDDFKMANNGVNWYLVCWELDNDLRAKTKYAPDSLPQDKYDAYQEIRERLRELMSERNVGFD